MQLQIKWISKSNTLLWNQKYRLNFHQTPFSISRRSSWVIGIYFQLFVLRHVNSAVVLLFCLCCPSASSVFLPSERVTRCPKINEIDESHTPTLACSPAGAKAPICCITRHGDRLNVALFIAMDFSPRARIRARPLSAWCGGEFHPIIKHKGLRGNFCNKTNAPTYAAHFQTS